MSKFQLNNNLALSLLAVILLLLPAKIIAQPYLDIINLKYSNSPNTGLFNHNKNATTIEYFNVGTNLPIQFKNKKDAVIISPFFEIWSPQINTNRRQNYYSLALPVTLSKTINNKWSFLLTGIVRMNDSSIYNKGKMQVGGALIVNYKRNEKLTVKLGAYANGEYFGLFVMPLLGIDWRINEKNNLFGVLPGNLTYEHKINDHFYYGANFRAITNSYANPPGYWRIEENQLGIYLDTYLNKNIVMNVEAGHSLFRKIQTGLDDRSKFNANANDNFYFKIAFSYRVRFTK